MGGRGLARHSSSVRVAAHCLLPTFSRNHRSLQHRMREAEQDFEEWAGPDAPYPWDWGGVVRLAVLGLGSPEARAPPRHQAALALAMAARLPGLQGKPLVSDPVFSAADVDALGALGFDVVSPAAACAPPPTPGASLAYLPHCEAALAEAVLEAHWSPNSLPRLALLGNSLTYVAARWDVAGAGPGGSAVTGGGAPPTAPPPRRRLRSPPAGRRTRSAGRCHARPPAPVAGAR